MKKGILAIALALILIFCFYLFEVYKFSNGELQDSYESFKYHKNYMNNLYIKGKIYNKIDERLYNKSHRFWIQIKLDKIKPKPNFSEQHFPTFYDFKGDSILSLIVSKSLFDSIQINQPVEKKPGVFIIVNNDKIVLLNNNKEKWLP